MCGRKIDNMMVETHASVLSRLFCVVSARGVGTDE